jgi:hypothetical protein
LKQNSRNKYIVLLGRILEQQIGDPAGDDDQVSIVGLCLEIILVMAGSGEAAMVDPKGMKGT